MNDIYQRVRLAGEKEDSDAIVAVLEKIRNGELENDLKVLNYFKEIPVSYPAQILTVEEAAAEFAVHQIQAVVISLEKMTVLKSRHFPRDVVANATYINIEKARLVLANLSYAIVRADRRMAVRVELSEPIYASFACPDGTVTGRLIDMSLTGLSVVSSQEPQVSLGQAGKLTLTMPISTITVSASILKVTGTEDGWRLAFQIEVNRATELAISQYLLRRQVEIIKELKEHPGLP